ncbi:thioesterase family protein [Elizabethkingia sp. JS20170427COW]|uniref:acyl-CoA thioesterase n=1 Tax=Elizabethkingia sp. JS20170427COW TaxID=2583851 RepID=UPI001110EBF7|nr:acyl-CoA thioesterase [Elizabethkingia sp. JS20170427COW]QCX53031.1 thioesterase [Elizabethkingia sp. JS20170427COW]
MSVFYHPFEVRWSDLDANFHLANSSYVMYCAQTRMAFMKKYQMGVSQLAKWGIGPVILKESYSFYKEIRSDVKVMVSLEVAGMSEDASIYSFVHKFYLEDGTHCATSEVTGVWIDMKTRKMGVPPAEVLETLKSFRTEKTVSLSMNDVKSLSQKPQNIDPINLK